jgi:hypothetical protein
VLRLAPLLLLGVLLAGCTAGTGSPAGLGSEAPTTPAASASAASGPAGTSDAASLLAGLRVAPEDHDAPYERSAFGYGDGEFDPDGDGCWTRREVLIRDHVGPLAIGRGCRLTGEWRSVYDGRTTTDPDAFSLDHLVPLAEAWRSGAAAWPSRRLVAYGNDLGYRWSLVAVTAAVNEEKGDQDPASWLPQRDRCTYVAAWIAVKSRWRLTVDPAEHAALAARLAACGPVRVATPPAPDLATLLP